MNKRKSPLPPLQRKESPKNIGDLMHTSIESRNFLINNLFIKEKEVENVEDTEADFKKKINKSEENKKNTIREFDDEVPPSTFMKKNSEIEQPERDFIPAERKFFEDDNIDWVPSFNQGNASQITEKVILEPTKLIEKNKIKWKPDECPDIIMETEKRISTHLPPVFINRKRTILAPICDIATNKKIVPRRVPSLVNSEKSDEESRQMKKENHTQNASLAIIPKQNEVKNCLVCQKFIGDVEQGALCATCCIQKNYTRYKWISLIVIALLIIAIILLACFLVLAKIENEDLEQKRKDLNGKYIEAVGRFYNRKSFRNQNDFNTNILVRALTQCRNGELASHLHTKLDKCEHQNIIHKNDIINRMYCKRDLGECRTKLNKCVSEIDLSIYCLSTAYIKNERNPNDYYLLKTKYDQLKNDVDILQYNLRSNNEIWVEKAKWLHNNLNRPNERIMGDTYHNMADTSEAIAASKIKNNIERLQLMERLLHMKDIFNILITVKQWSAFRISEKPIDQKPELASKNSANINSKYLALRNEFQIQQSISKNNQLELLGQLKSSNSAIRRLHLENIVIKSSLMDRFKVIHDGFVILGNIYIRHKFDLQKQIIGQKNDIDIHHGTLMNGNPNPTAEIYKIKEYLNTISVPSSTTLLDDVRENLERIKLELDSEKDIRQYKDNVAEEYSYVIKSWRSKCSSLTKFISITDKGFYSWRISGEGVFEGSQIISDILTIRRGSISEEGMYIVGGINEIYIYNISDNTPNPDVTLLSIKTKRTGTGLVNGCIFLKTQTAICYDERGYIYEYNLRLSRIREIYKSEGRGFLSGVVTEEGLLIVGDMEGGLHVLAGGRYLLATNIYNPGSTKKVHGVAQVRTNYIVTADYYDGCYLHQLLFHSPVVLSSANIINTNDYYYTVLALASGEGVFGVAGQRESKGFIDVHQLLDNNMGIDPLRTKSTEGIGGVGCKIETIVEIKTRIIVFGGGWSCNVMCMWHYAAVPSVSAQCWKDDITNSEILGFVPL